MVKSVISISIESEVANQSGVLEINRSAICQEALRWEIERLTHQDGDPESKTLGMARFMNHMINQGKAREKMQELCKLARSPKGSQFYGTYNQALKDYCEEYGVELSEALKIAESYDVPKEKVAPKEKGDD